MVCYQVGGAVDQVKTVEMPLIFATCYGTRYFQIALEIEYGKRISLQTGKYYYNAIHFLLRTRQDVNDDCSNLRGMTHNMSIPAAESEVLNHR